MESAGREGEGFGEGTDLVFGMEVGKGGAGGAGQAGLNELRHVGDVPNWGTMVKAQETCHACTAGSDEGLIFKCGSVEGRGGKCFGKRE